jgi:hypothetical protein
MADVWIGLDLGQLTDFSAAAVLRRTLAIDPVTGRVERRRTGHPHFRFDAMAIRRYPLGTPYVSIVAHIVDQLQRPELAPRPRLVVDSTGVGIAVMEMFRDALRPLPAVECHALTITSGRSWSCTGRHAWNVSKIELVAAAREALEARRLKVPPGLDHADTLKRELLDFRVKITTSANETFSAREGQHDDIVLCVALPIWLASQKFGCAEFRTLDGEPLTERELSAISSERAEIEQAEREALAAEAAATRREREQAQWESDDPAIWDQFVTWDS